MRSTVVIAGVDNDQLRATAKANPLSDTQVSMDHSGTEACRKGEKLAKWVPHQGPKTRKKKSNHFDPLPSLSLWNKLDCDV